MTDRLVTEPLVSIDQLAVALSVSTRTLRRWRDEGMPHYSQGATIRFRVSEVEQWMRSDRSQETAA